MTTRTPRNLRGVSLFCFWERSGGGRRSDRAVQGRCCTGTRLRAVLFVREEGRFGSASRRRGDVRMNTVHWRSRSALLVLVVALVGCASDRDEAGGPVDGGEVTVVAFTAEPPRIGVGQASRLRWQTENATRVVLYEDGVPLDGEPLPLDGALEVRPKRTSV